ncbi:MAG: alpha/beta hydrolase [Deltaproteobacteria bacterium]|nr:alpha/beta hydrolase [Deltaproteobacteria bacterium]
MRPVTYECVRWAASDGVELTGFLTGARCHHVALYLHGLGGNGYRATMIPALAGALRRSGIGLFAINTRGHDIVAARTRGRRRSNTNGAVYEVFTECLHDLRGAMTYLRTRGVRTVSLIGHSTGANKIAYALQRRCRVRGLRIASAVYLAPGDDIGIQRRWLGVARYHAMQRLAVRLRRRDPFRLMPVKNLGYLDISAASYHSLYGERSRMDQFPFRMLQRSAKWRRLARQQIPGMIVLGVNDEYLPTSAAAIRDFLTATCPKLPVQLVPHAGHSFHGREQAMASVVSDFVRRTKRVFRTTC